MLQKLKEKLDKIIYSESQLFIYLGENHERVYCKECSVEFPKNKLEEHVKYFHFKG